MVQVILSCNTNREYLYYMPIAAFFWHKIVGYKTVIVLVGTKEDWQMNKTALLAIEFTKKLCPDTEFVYLENKTKYPAHLISQLMRPLIALKYPNDFSILSDMDMLPLKKDYFKVIDESKLHYFDPGVLGNPPYEMAMCYIGANGRLWQKLLKAEYKDVTPEYIERIVDKYKKFSRVKKYSQWKNKSFWGVDQMYMTDYVLHSNEYKTNLFKSSPRDLDSKNNFLNDRIDKANWKFEAQKKGYYIDAHLGLKKPWNKKDNNWEIFHKILEEYIPNNIKDINEYTDKFAESLELEAKDLFIQNKEVVKDAVIITAVSNDYFSWLLNMIGSIQNNYPNHPPIVVYSLGLRKSYVKELQSISGVVVKNIPPFVSYWRKCYTWKLWVMNDAPGDIIYYLDSASEVLRPLTEIFEIIKKDGYFCVDQKHAGDMAFLKMITPTGLLRKLDLNDNFCGERLYFAGGNFGYKKNTVYHDLIKEGLKLAEEGWTLGWSVKEQDRNKGNDYCPIIRDCQVFRHDQTLLNVLFCKKFSTFTIHNENKYGAFQSKNEHPQQLVWNSRKYNKNLIYLNKVRYTKKQKLLIFVNRLFYFWAVAN